VPYADIERVFMAEFGRPPHGENGVFEEFEECAVASASIAQVHRAKLKGQTGVDDADRWVAVKVQKPAVSQQVEWDLAAYRAMMWMYEK
jgi:aarF domain-containing kinase